MPFVTGPRNFLLFSRRRDIQRVSFDTPDQTNVVLPIFDIKQATALGFDPIDKYVYWSDVREHVIKRADMNGTGKFDQLGLEEKQCSFTKKRIILQPQNESGGE